MNTHPNQRRRDSSEEFARKYPHHHRTLMNRADISRRGLFQMAAGLTGSFLWPVSGSAAPLVETSGVTTHNTAKKVIFIHLTGAMSHVDTLDFKPSAEMPSGFAPATINGIEWPGGLLPKIGGHLGDVAIVRSVSSWALVHSLAQTWVQIGRNPAAALGDIAPNVGSVVALEKAATKLPTQVFPTFIGLNAGAASGAGYLPAAYAPFQVTPRAGSSGISNTTNSGGQQVFDGLYARLGQYDGAMRAFAPYGTPLADMAAMYDQARGLMYNPVVDAAFTLTQEDNERYGASNFGNACALARQILGADQGAQFVQINFGNWDHHANIYADNNLPGMGAQLDNGLGALLDDLKNTGRLSETLVIVMGEFGRTPGISAAEGRDHYLIQSVLLAGGGVKGGKVIGATNTGANAGGTVVEYGWAGSGNTGPRLVRPEDIECTLYSAMGIDWTTVRYDDPFGRGYEYVPFAKDGVYGPINELFV